MARAPRVAIIGGGIGGLTLALALRARGIGADVFEQAQELTEIGAAVALSANGTRELGRLGLSDALAAVSTEPTELVWRDGRTGRRIAAHPMRQGGRYRDRFGAGFCGIHRADLQRILHAAHGDDGLHLGHRLAELSERRDAVRLAFANGRVAEAQLVVGADGVRSRVRGHVAGGEDAVYSGTSGFRGIVPIGRLPSLPDPQAIQFWMGPGAHLLHYAIGGGGESVNFLAVVEGPPTWTHPDGWMAPADDGDALAGFAGWHPAVVEMVGAVSHGVRWGLFAAPPLWRWSRGRVVLLGDAAHAMLPHHGQGANTTIEDAATLAELLAGKRDEDFGAALRAYEMLRRPRTRRIQRSSWVTNAALHLPDGPALGERAARLARFPAEFGWIHEFDALRSCRHGGAA